MSAHRRTISRSSRMRVAGSRPGRVCSCDSRLIMRRNDRVSTRIRAIQWRDGGLAAVKFTDGPVVAEADLAGIFGLFSLVEYRPWHRRLSFKFRDGYDFEC